MRRFCHIRIAKLLSGVSPRPDGRASYSHADLDHGCGGRQHCTVAQPCKRQLRPSPQRFCLFHYPAARHFATVHALGRMAADAAGNLRSLPSTRTAMVVILVVAVDGFQTRKHPSDSTARQQVLRYTRRHPRPPKSQHRHQHSRNPRIWRLRPLALTVVTTFRAALLRRFFTDWLSSPERGVPRPPCSCAYLHALTTPDHPTWRRDQAQ